MSFKRKTITIDEKHCEFIEENNINLSKLVRKIIEREIKKRK